MVRSLLANSEEDRIAQLYLAEDEEEDTEVLVYDYVPPVSFDHGSL